MPKFGKEAKQRAMMLWSDYVTLEDIAEEIGCSRLTVAKWRDNNDPVNWYEFKSKAATEMERAALTEIRKEAGRRSKIHLKNLENQRMLNEGVTALLAKQYKAIAEVEDGETVDKADLDAFTKTLRLVIMNSGDIQSQESPIFNLPTHRIQLNQEPRPVLSDSALKAMDEKQLVEICLNVLEVKDEDKR